MAEWYRPLIWRGFLARRYGPNAKYKIPRMPRLFWHIEGREFFRRYRLTHKSSTGAGHGE